MYCEDFRRLASRVHDGEGSAADEKELSLHIGTCEDCRRFVSTLDVLSALHGSMSEDRPPSHLLDSVLDQTGRRDRVPVWWKAGVAAAAAVVIMLGVWTGTYLTGRLRGDVPGQQADAFEMQYFEAHPPGSLGEALAMEGGDDV